MRLVSIWTFLLFLRCHISQVRCITQRPKIAIIGAGIGGASTSFFLNQLFGENGAEIDVYEKQHVGGRLATTKIDGHAYEVGGSALHPKNKYMADFTKQLGLAKRHVYGIRLGLFDGKKYLLLEGDRSVSAYGTLFHRYGNSLSNWHTVIDRVLNKFLRIYEVQDKGYAFTSVDKLLAAADPVMVNLTQMTARQYLLDNGLLHVFVNEIATGVVRICYGQTPDVNAFVGTISLAGAKAGLWGVRGGNELVPQLLIKNSKSNLVWARVTKVSLKPGNKFEVESVLANTDNDKEFKLLGQASLKKTYDIVIVATPLIDGISNITFESFPHSIGNFKGQYHPSVTTLVNGKINTTFLESGYDDSQLDEILTTTENTLFSSLTRVYPVNIDEEWNQTTKVWKLVTQHPPTDNELDLIFAERKSEVSASWLAYPHYTPPEKLGPFVLYPFLFYTSSIDWAASAMEMSAISGKNAALLAYYQWKKILTHIDSYSSFHTEL